MAAFNALDPEIGASMMALFSAGAPPTPDIGDYQTRRNNMVAMFTAMSPPMSADVETKDYELSGGDGHKLAGRLYTKKGAPKGGAGILYLHGGGYIGGGGLDPYDSIIARYVSVTGVPFFAPDYRLAPEAQYPVPVDDAHKALLFMLDQAEEFGFDPKRFAVMGDSGGGGLAAALVHYNLEKNGPPIAKQILVYPMLDDRNIKKDPHVDEIAVWKAADNETGWQALLGDKRGSADVKPSAAPARMTSTKGQPPAFIDCGTLDIFCVEDVEYAKKLLQDGVTTELHIYPGAVHAFELIAPQAQVTQKALQNRFNAINSIVALP